MATSQKRDFGYLCRVKKTHPKGPDMTGLLEINGVRFQLSSWVKVSKRGAKYLSLARLRAWTRTAIPSFAKERETHAGKSGSSFFPDCIPTIKKL